MRERLGSFQSTHVTQGAAGFSEALWPGDPLLFFGAERLLTQRAVSQDLSWAESRRLGS